MGDVQGGGEAILTPSCRAVACASFGVVHGGGVVLAIALGMAITLAAIGMASMVAHRLIIGDGRSQAIGRATSIVASLIVIATAGTLLLGALERFIR